MDSVQNAKIPHTLDGLIKKIDELEKQKKTELEQLIAAVQGLEKLEYKMGKIEEMNNLYKKLIERLDKITKAIDLLLDGGILEEKPENEISKEQIKEKIKYYSGMGKSLGQMIQLIGDALETAVNSSNNERNNNLSDSTGPDNNPPSVIDSINQNLKKITSRLKESLTEEKFEQKEEGGQEPEEIG